MAKRDRIDNISCSNDGSISVNNENNYIFNNGNNNIMIVIIVQCSDINGDGKKKEE